MQAFITDADLASAMVAAAASLRRRRLSSLSILSVQQPVTQLGAEVTIVIQQLAAEAGAYEAVSDSHEAVMAAAAIVDAASISQAMVASGAAVQGLAVAKPTIVAIARVVVPDFTCEICFCHLCCIKRLSTRSRRHQNQKVQSTEVTY